ncbi:hypothetical protein B0J12DRAFT_650008 [Macrophomina phaseolina]|nr:hypothetical protein B0J12DRAFT_650008 [Macrophomina phaseolina]
MSTHTTPGHATPYSGRRSGGFGSRGGGRGRGRSTPSKQQQRGKFDAGVWYCDCVDNGAPLPAAKFKVRKEGPNKGRWFWTCQKKGEAGCGFFLWEEDASVRMEGAVLDGGSVGGARSGFDTRTAPAPHAANRSAKRKFQEEVDGEEPETEDEDEEDDEYGWRKDVGVEAAISSALDAAMTPTPRKALKGREGATPGGSSMMTPVSARRGLADTAGTPASARLGMTTTTPSSVKGDDAANDTLVPEVLQLLKEKGVNMDKETGDALQKLLRTHSLRMQGLARGRDVARLAVREKTAQSAELQARIASLEAELETQRAVIANLNWQKETGQFE